MAAEKIEHVCPGCGHGIYMKPGRRFYCACGTQSVAGGGSATKPRKLPDNWDGQCIKKWYRAADLVADTLLLLSQLPPNIGRVIGVPRSGMTPATIIATNLHVPLFSLSRNGIVPLSGGDRMNGGRKPDGPTLLVDDSIGIGRQFDRLEQRLPMDTYLKAVVYLLPKSRRRVDFFAREVPAPHLFEWNFFNGWFMQRAALDMDGVICRDQSHEPLYVPRNVACKAIITARPESEREKTEAWLRRHGARYDRLFMWQGDPAARNLQTQADYKANLVREHGYEMYVESCPFLAAEMRRRGVRVLCPKEGILQ